jgi:hypothetical protein
MAGDGGLYIGERAVGILVHQVRAAHDHAGRAEAALKRVVLDECLLHRM